MSPPLAVAQNPSSCDGVFSNVVPSPGRVQQGNRVFLTHLSPVKDQCHMGTCHLYAWTSALEQPIRRSNPEHKDLQLSARYLTAAHMREQYLWYLTTEMVNHSVELGASAHDSRDIILKYGLVPEDAWQPKTDFDGDGDGAAFRSKLHSIFEELKAAKRAHEMRGTPEKVTPLITEAQQKVSQLFDKYVGTLPQSFTYQGRTYSPKDFQETFFPELSETMVVMKVREDMPPQEKIFDEFKLIERRSLLEDVKAKARRLLDLGQPVLLGFLPEEFFLNQNGEFRIAGSPKNKPGWVASSRMEFMMKDMTRMPTHMVLLVGYEFDPATNQVTKWIIKNSYGVEYGDKGYQYLYADYFDTYVNDIVYIAKNPK